VTRRVKGLLFLHYVRMLKARKQSDWGRHLLPADLGFLEQPIEPAASYPMDVFERLGLAVLDEIARGELGAVREWGRQSADLLVESVRGLLVPGDPRESLMRFQAMRGAFFDFDAVALAEVTDRTARIEMSYEMGDRAEQAASTQALGFFQRLVELAGGREVRAAFEARAWEGDGRTVAALAWT
jgi:uncharacterized protein (TIGR02265 family)